MVGSPIEKVIPTWKSGSLDHYAFTSGACFKTLKCGQDQGGRSFQPEAQQRYVED
jgi:hypothetical protein